MDNICNIKYVDAYYSYDKHLKETKLSVFEAHGYVEKNKNDIIVVFIKEKNVSVKSMIKEKKKMPMGLVIPDTALIAVSGTNNNLDAINDLTEGVFLSVTWNDIVFVANVARYECAVIYTEGVLYKIKNDHIVIKDPETIHTHPFPVKNHPIKAPNYYIIPTSLISDVSVIK